MRAKIFLLLMIVSVLFIVIHPATAQQGLQLIIHSIEAQPIEQQQQVYNVNVHLSVLDSKNEPVSGLGLEDFVIKENGKDVVPTELISSTDLPMNIIIMIDTGATMSGRVQYIREAVSQFIDSLGSGNQIAVFTFADKVTQIVPLTDDPYEANDIFNSVRIVANGNSCLIDAGIQAAQLAGTFPPGRRAVILITDSWDVTKKSSGCSYATLDDVINIASQGQNAVPFYPVGVIKNTDEDSLTRLAARTGGLYLYAANNESLNEVFTSVYQTISSELVISYISTSEPGTHSVSVQYGDLVQTRSVSLPSLPPLISFLSPSDGDFIKPEVHDVSISIRERGIPFSTLTFMINDVAIGVGGRSDEKPFTYPIDFSQFSDSEVDLTCILFDEAGNQITSQTLILSVLPVGVEAPIVVTETSQADQTAPDETSPSPVFLGLNLNELLIIASVLLVGIVVITASIIMFVKKKRGTIHSGSILKRSPQEGATMDGLSLLDSAMGTITVLSSDDPALVGKEYVLAKNGFSIGRSVENDLAFPKDTAVSRRHIVIMDKKGVACLREEMKSLSDGTKSPPTYGTYINDRKISGEVVLHNGDEISLGRRTKLRFTKAGVDKLSSESEDMTYDGLEKQGAANSDATLDG